MPDLIVVLLGALDFLMLSGEADSDVRPRIDRRRAIILISGFAVGVGGALVSGFVLGRWPLAAIIAGLSFFLAAMLVLRLVWIRVSKPRGRP